MGIQPEEIQVRAASKAVPYSLPRLYYPNLKLSSDDTAVIARNHHGG